MPFSTCILRADCAIAPHCWNAVGWLTNAGRPSRDERRHELLHHRDACPAGQVLPGCREDAGSIVPPWNRRGADRHWHRVSRCACPPHVITWSRLVDGPLTLWSSDRAGCERALLVNIVSLYGRGRTERRESSGRSPRSRSKQRENHRKAVVGADGHDDGRSFNPLVLALASHSVLRLRAMVARSSCGDGRERWPGGQRCPGWSSGRLRRRH